MDRHQWNAYVMGFLVACALYDNRASVDPFRMHWLVTIAGFVAVGLFAAWRPR